MREALETARQMAVALEAAHRRGIIHRDLKPANVKVTPDGRVKLLDFGLAKALERESSPATPPDGISAADTHEGLVVGTAAYMSPEQARGLTLDPRTDLWSFGCVLFELLTGRQAFSGSSISDVLASILVREPDWERPAGRHPGRRPAPSPALPEQGRGSPARRRRARRGRDRGDPLGPFRGRGDESPPRLRPAPPASHVPAGGPRGPGAPRRRRAGGRRAHHRRSGAREAGGGALGPGREGPCGPSVPGPDRQGGRPARRGRPRRDGVGPARPRLGRPGPHAAGDGGRSATTPTGPGSRASSGRRSS